MSVADRVVVMRKGRIVEEGAPEALYNRPREVFTANFVGESNFLEGAAQRIRGDWAFVELRSGYVLRVPAKGIHEGDALVLAERPDSLALTSGAFGNVIPGRVEDRRFLGATERHQVRLATDDLVSGDIPVSQSLNTKRDVMVSFPEANILVYPRPYAGLQEALKLE